MWVARDKNGSLFLHLEEPYKSNDEWTAGYNYRDFYKLDKNLFPEVKWKNEKATEIKLIPKSFIEESKDIHNQISVVLKDMARAKFKRDKLLESQTLTKMESLLIQIQQHLSLVMLLI